VVTILVLQRKFFKEKGEDQENSNVAGSQETDSVVLFKPAEEPPMDPEKDKMQHG
jgi:hypothetical protein